MEGMSSIGVVIPAHNAAATVGEAVASALAQTTGPAAVVVVADSCTDDTVAVARRAGAEVIDTTAGGPGAARNHGVASLRTPWIAFLDADDLWRPTWLAAVQRRMQEIDRISLFYGTWTEEDAKGTRLSGHEPRRPSGDLFETLLCDAIIATPAVVVRREVFLTCGGFDPNLPVAEDYDLWLKIAAQHRLGAVQGQHVIVRRVEPSAMRTPRNARALRDCAMLALERAMQVRPVSTAVHQRAKANALRMSGERLLAHGAVLSARRDLRQALELTPRDWRLWAMAGLTATPPGARAALLKLRRRARVSLPEIRARGARNHENS